MATKAERFKTEVQRTSGKKTTQTSAKPRTRSAVKAVAAGMGTARRNLSKGKKAVYALEDTVASKRPSRKSTRRSKDAHKAGTVQRGVHLHKMDTPRERHTGGHKAG